MEGGVVAQIGGLIGRGELIGACDVAREALAAGQDGPRLRYLSVLALARAGATAQAASEYARLNLHRSGDVDALSLWGRILKDAALAAPPGERSRYLVRAARAYRRVHDRTGHYFPGINVATLTHLGGRTAEARELAEALLAVPDIAVPADYYAGATRGEALALLGRWEEATAAFEAARALPGADPGSVASTRKQLALLLSNAIPHSAVADRLLAVLHLPRVLHVTAGHLRPDRDEGELARAVDAVLDVERPGSAVGSLWTDGALFVAERLLARGVELHLVLPFGQDDFLAWFARTAAPGEVERRSRCLAAAATVTTATADGDFPDPELVAYAELIASGLAVARARRLATECVELELARPVSPGRDDGAPDGTGRAASARGRRVYAVAPGTGAAAPTIPLASKPLDASSLAASSLAASLLAEVPHDREIRTFLFADVYGFSSIPESGLPAFWSRFMRGLGGVVDAAGSEVLHRNTWGDALFLVIADVLPAAELALAIQEKAAEMGRAEPDAPVLRIGLHHGPVFRGTDPIRGGSGYFGTQVSRAARVEPIVPPGAVYVTEPFAALLAATGSRAFEAEYVGRIVLPKKYGEHRMYRLARRWATSN